VPQAERAAEEDSRKRLAQEMSRLQSTLEYLLLKGDMAAAQHEVAVLAHNHDVIFAALADDGNEVIAATQRAWLGRQVADVLPQFASDPAAEAIRERRAGTIDSSGDALLGHAGILMGSEREELRPSRTGSVFLAYDLKRYKAEARAQVLQQSLYWAGWVTALALAMWLVFHFLLTRRTARLVHAAEELAAGNLASRSALKGNDELGRMSRAFDAMALAISMDITERKRSDEALRVSEASYRAIFDAAEDAIFVVDIETATIVDANPRACGAFGYSREEFRQIDLGTLSSGVHPYTQEGAMELFDRAVAGEQLRVEWHGKYKDGSLRWRRYSASAYHRRTGPDTALARDITDRKMAEEALRAVKSSITRCSTHRSTDWRCGTPRARSYIPIRPLADVWLQRRRVLRIAAR
jgi:two-component system NtrC family sensor kinase